VGPPAEGACSGAANVTRPLSTTAAMPGGAATALLAVAPLPGCPLELASAVLLAALVLATANHQPNSHPIDHHLLCEANSDRS
jgi:hypothetical protein